MACLELRIIRYPNLCTSIACCLKSIFELCHIQKTFCTFGATSQMALNLQNSLIKNLLVFFNTISLITNFFFRYALVCHLNFASFSLTEEI